METQSGLTALNLVLRDRNAIAALPSVVRSIRRFAQASLFKRFERLLSKNSDAISTANPDVTAVEHFLRVHAEDRRFETLENGRDANCWLESASLYTKKCFLKRVLVYGAQVGSVPIVNWVIDAHLERELIIPGLTKAIDIGHMVIVKLLYSMMPAIGFEDEKTLITTAAKHGRVEALEWLFAQRSEPRAGFPAAAACTAAETGQLEALQWTRAMFPNSVSWNVLQQAALNDQLHIMDWFYDERLPISHFWLMWTTKQALQLRKIRSVMWVHEKYSSCSIPLADLDEYIRLTCDVESVRKIIKAFPKQYVSQGLAIGATYGDFELIKAHTVGRKVKHRELKRAMHRAAGHGHLAVIDYLHELSGGTCLPATVLWRALRCGYIDIVCWILEHKPTLRTRERLAEMRDVSVRQMQSNAEGDLMRVTQWLDVQLGCLQLCRDVTSANRLADIER